MVSIYGLNERIGNRSYYDSRGENSFTKPYSEETARIIDEEVSAVIEKAYDRAKDILATNRDKLEALACWTTRSSSRKTSSAFWVRVRSFRPPRRWPNPLLSPPPSLKIQLRTRPKAQRRRTMPKRRTTHLKARRRTHEGMDACDAVS